MSRRVQQVAGLLKREISDLIREIFPEELGLITVIDVNLTADLKEAIIYISCLEKEKEKQIISLFDSRTRDFQHYLGQRLKLRFTPKLTFRLDESLGRINRIDELLNKVEKDKK